MPKTSKARNARPPMTPPTIGPVLLLELACDAGMLVAAARAPADVIIAESDPDMVEDETSVERVEAGENRNDPVRVEGAACEND